VTAETFLDVCNAYVLARDAGHLTNFQEQTAIRAGMFLAACAKVGLIALIDEATGYQYERAETALQFKLKLYVQEEMRKWERTFPDELWVEFQRLTRWSGPLHERPKYWGKLVMELIYEYLDPDVADWLRRNAPRPQHGQNYHQWLSGQFGLKKLIQHIWMVIGMARACYSMHELRRRMAEHYGLQPAQITMYLPPPAKRSVNPRLFDERPAMGVTASTQKSRAVEETGHTRASQAPSTRTMRSRTRAHTLASGRAIEQLDSKSEVPKADARSLDEKIVMKPVLSRERSEVEIRVHDVPDWHVIAKDKGHKLGQTLHLYGPHSYYEHRSTGRGVLRREAVGLAAEWIRTASATNAVAQRAAAL
jgi:hypothetical protein